MISLSARNTQNRRSTGWMRRECLAAVTPTFQAPAPTAAVQCPPSLRTYGTYKSDARAGTGLQEQPHRPTGGAVAGRGTSALPPVAPYVAGAHWSRLLGRVPAAYATASSVLLLVLCMCVSQSFVTWLPSPGWPDSG
jgi:hypothetical protein